MAGPDHQDVDKAVFAGINSGRCSAELASGPHAEAGGGAVLLDRGIESAHGLVGGGIDISRIAA